MFHTDGNQSRCAFVRNGPTRAADAFKQALAVAGVKADTPATVLCDGDAGLWRMQREALPGATVVLDWWHTAVRFGPQSHQTDATVDSGIDLAASLPTDGGTTTI